MVLVCLFLLVLRVVVGGGVDASSVFGAGSGVDVLLVLVTGW